MNSRIRKQVNQIKSEYDELFENRHKKKLTPTPTFDISKQWDWGLHNHNIKKIMERQMDEFKNAFNEKNNKIADLEKDRENKGSFIIYTVDPQTKKVSSRRITAEELHKRYPNIVDNPDLKQLANNITRKILKSGGRHVLNENVAVGKIRKQDLNDDEKELVSQLKRTVVQPQKGKKARTPKPKTKLVKSPLALNFDNLKRDGLKIKKIKEETARQLAENKAHLEKLSTQIDDKEKLKDELSKKIEAIEVPEFRDEKKYTKELPKLKKKLKEEQANMAKLIRELDEKKDENGELIPYKKSQNPYKKQSVILMAAQKAVDRTNSYIKDAETFNPQIPELQKQKAQLEKELSEIETDIKDLIDKRLFETMRGKEIAENELREIALLKSFDSKIKLTEELATLAEEIKDLEDGEEKDKKKAIGRELQAKLEKVEEEEEEMFYDAGATSLSAAYFVDAENELIDEDGHIVGTIV